MLVTLNLEDIASVVAEAVEQQVTQRTAGLRTEVDDLKAEADALRELMFQQKLSTPDISTEIGAHVRAHLIDALEEMELPAGHSGPPGPEGPAGRDGVDGWNGQDGAPGPQGEKGDPGVDGHDGPPGPEGQKGLDGADGYDGLQGADGEDGKDGRGLAGAIIDRSGWLVVTFTDGSTAQLGQVVGKDGEPGINGKDGIPGADGRDGLGFDDFEFKQVGKRDWLAVFVQGDRRKEFPMKFDVPLDAGVWSAGQTYEAGDMVTRGGSMWIAQEQTAEEPGAGATKWRLCVKRGSNGKDGKDGKAGQPGPEGKQGRDLTQKGPDGSKW